MTGSGKSTLMQHLNGLLKPTDGKVLAPCDATVDTMFDTGHAVSLTTENGVEILTH